MRFLLSYLNETTIQQRDNLRWFYFNTIHHKRANAIDDMLAESLNQHFAAISKQIL